MRSVTPSIESAVSRLAPGFRALSIVVESAPVADPAVAEQALAEACPAVQQDDVPWAQAHLAAWDEAFSSLRREGETYPLFGAGAAQAGAERGEPAGHRSGGGYLPTRSAFAMPSRSVGKIWPPTVANRGWPLPAAMSHSIR